MSQSPPLTDLLGGLSTEAAQLVQSALTRAIAAGDSIASIAKAVMAALNTSLYRALTVARNVLVNAQRGAVSDVLHDTHEPVAGWLWIANIGGTPTPCIACILMHGTRHPLSQVMLSHTNCRCQMVAYFADNPDIAGQSGVDWLLAQDSATQQAVMGMKRWLAWKQGKITLQDMLGTDSDGRIYVKTLKELGVQ